jgi:hypothetical protein
MADHTPGPWQFNPGKPYILARQTHPNGGEHWFSIANVEPTKAAAPRGGCDPQSQANGRLMATSWKLLAAAKAAVRELQADEDDCTAYAHTDATQQLEDAIAEAEGES